MNSDSNIKVRPQTLKEKFKEATNDSILLGAERIFAQQGLHAARMEDIAADAGVSVGTLYNHFEDRESLLSSLVEARQIEFLIRLDQRSRKLESDSFDHQLEGFISAVLEHFHIHRPFFTILMEGEHARDCKTFPISLSKPRLTMEQLCRRVEALVQRGLQSGALRPEDSEIYPTMLMGMLKGILVRSLFAEDVAEPTAKRVGQMVRFFTSGAGTSK